MLKVNSFFSYWKSVTMICNLLTDWIKALLFYIITIQIEANWFIELSYHTTALIFLFNKSAAIDFNHWYIQSVKLSVSFESLCTKCLSLQGRVGSRLVPNPNRQKPSIKSVQNILGLNFRVRTSVMKKQNFGAKFFPTIVLYSTCSFSWVLQYISWGYCLATFKEINGIYSHFVQNLGPLNIQDRVKNANLSKFATYLKKESN